MARYHNEFIFQADPNMLLQQIHQYMMAEGYEYRDFKGEPVYKKGMGIATGPSFVKIMAGSGRIIVEAWIKFAALPGVYAGEMDLDGVVGAIPRSVLRGRVNQIEYLIVQAGGQYVNGFGAVQPNVPQQNIQQPPYTSVQPPQQAHTPVQPMPQPQSVQPVQTPQAVQPEPSVQKPAPAFCDQCGNKLEPTALFCNQCGNKVKR